MKIILVLFLAALLAALCCSPVFAAQTQEDEDQFWDDTVPMGQVIEGASFTTIDGETFDTDQALKEKKALLINFFMVSCYACMEEFPLFNDLAEIYGDQVAFLALDSNGYDTEDEIRELRDELGIDLPIAQELEWQLSEQIPYIGYPCTIVLDKNGTLVFYQDYGIDSADELVEMFDEILAEDYEGGYEVCHSYDIEVEGDLEEAEEALSGYKILVKDQNQDPIPNVMINFCSEIQQTCRMEGTNEDGEIFFEVPEDSYHISILAAPEGYSYDKDFEMYTTDYYSDPIDITITKN